MNQRRRKVKRVIAILMALFIVATTAYYGNTGSALAEATGAVSEDRASAGSADEEVNEISGQSDDGQPEDQQTDGSGEEEQQTPDENSGSTDESGENSGGSSNVPGQTEDNSSSETTEDPASNENTEETTVNTAENSTDSQSEDIHTTDDTLAVEESFYQKLIAAGSCKDMFDLFNENTEAALSMTADEIAQIRTKLDSMDDDGYKEEIQANLDYLAEKANYPDAETYNNTATFNPSISNATVVYVNYTANTDVNDISFTEVDGNFSTNYNNNTNTYWLFFVKPDDNYLLTGLGADGNNDLYPTSTTDFGNISSYPNISTIVAKAKQQGYVALFGYTRNTRNQTENISFVVNCQSPDISVSAVSNKEENVKPGDELTFTVTITPGHTTSGKDKVEGVTIQDLTVNGKDVSYSDVTDNGDGTYSVTVPYTATAEDCASGSVKLDVTANVKYSGTMTLSDTSGDTGEVGTTATITKSATTECLIAPKNKVTYTHTYNTGGETIDSTTYPEEIKTDPVDNTTYYTGQKVTVDTTYPGKQVTDTVNGGVWTFDGWYHGDQIVTEETMTDNGLIFTGVWKFKRTYYTLTLTKNVTGNMGNKSKKFAFTVSTSSGELAAPENGNCTLNTDKTVSAGLHDGESATITVPAGATITITENGRDGYTSTVYTVNDTKNSEQTDKTASSAVCEIEAISANTDVQCTNEKEEIIDTGIGMDAVPYILILSLVAAGAGYYTLTIRKRHSR